MKLIKYYKGLSFTLIALAFSTVLTAQTNMDSLRSEWNRAVQDSVKVEVGIALMNHYRTSNSDSAIFFGEHALKISRQPQMKQLPNYEGRALTYLGMAYGYTSDEKRKGIEYLKEAVPFFHKENNLEQLAYNYFCIGYFFGSHLFEYDSAVYYYNKATVLSDTLFTAYVAGSYNNAGLALYRMGDYENSMKYYVSALDMRKEISSVYDVACTILNMGMAYDKLNQPQKAKSHYSEALNGFVEAGHIPNQAVSYKNIADVLTAQDSLSKALEYYDEASKLFEKVNNIYLLSDCFLNMGTIYVKLGQYKKADNFLLNAESNVPEGASESFKSQIYSHLARVKKVLADSVYVNDNVLKRRALKAGASYGEQAWELANASNSLEVKVMAAKSLVDIYEELGDYEKGFRYAKLLNDANLETGEKTQSEAMARMATEYETEKVEAENFFLQQTQRSQEAQLKQQRYLIIAAFIVLMLIIVLVIIVQRSRLGLKRANLKVQRSLGEKELLLKEIHHRVKNNLQVISSLLELQSFGIEDEKALSTFMEGQNRVKAMALIHQKLYQNENLATIDFAEYAEQLSQDLANIYPNASKVSTSVHADGEVKFDIDTAVPLGLILNELISNSYKYAFNEKDSGQLQVSIAAIGDGKHQLMVEDNGKGLSQGFDLERAKSLGLRLVNRLAEQLYGTVEYYGDQGAKFVINFEESLNRNPS
ncbi:histidine kinase dimerization/phosphoacceptor domain -containing protein [uncultured Roseivirga sp.]|uniref:tetratricopeptide repeat-containing sensor histidine kinase n=1 Tax=uncultured Roseivirga sp. TaxID=543088 RepID=UPI002583005B|nr:histidine kinase dimerization/phosphoacceptor domain -containing protein [uncultured Roseivirga sp.]